MTRQHQPWSGDGGGQRWRSFVGSRVQPALLNHIKHRLGDEVVERSAVTEPATKIGARHFETWHFDTDPVDVVRQVNRVTWTIDHDQVRRCRYLIRTRPTVETSRGVITDNGEELGTRMFNTERLQRVSGEAVATVVDLGASCHQARNVFDSGNDHCKAVVGRRDLPSAFLLPRHVVHHQDDLIKP